MQTHARLLHEWTRQVATILVGMRVTQVRPLALFTLGMVWAGQVRVLRVAAALPLPCRLLSTERRLRRWLANSRIDVATVWRPLLRSLVPRVTGAEVVVVLDPTTMRGRATLVILSVVCHSRALPVSWRIMPQQQAWPQALAPTLTAMVAEVQAALPTDTSVTLLADRGLVGPAIVDICQAAGWHLVLRLRASSGETTRVRDVQGRMFPVGQLLTAPGQRLVCPVSLFKAAGWRAGWLTVHWTPGHAEPWVLFSDRPGGPERVREYRTRMRVEATYQDWKRRGFGLEQSRITDPAHLAKLLLVLVLATWWLFGLGHAAIHAGVRPTYDRANRRTRSLIQLGHAHLVVLATGRGSPLPFRCTPTGCSFRWLL